MPDMNVILEVAKGAAATVATFVTMLFLIPGKYTSLKHTTFSLSTKKRKKLDALLGSDRWKTAPAVELELAFADAFGFAVDGRLIRYMFERRNIIPHIRNIKKCQLMVRLSADGQSLEPVQARRCSFRTSAIRAFFTGLIPFALLLFTVPLMATVVPKLYFAWSCGVILVWSPFVCGFAGASKRPMTSLRCRRRIIRWTPIWSTLGTAR
ncbi:MAG TPA: hypothetical protein VM621_00745 [Luteibacter sp.]|uniref:hypothetical protein n=1 Tax=Luteibacter sp. TaxID=1886636 RepID=UPI002C6470DB|nr:hypothetical protein [Luteibacter sp.]HVI53561.1 hypothetical protein [Luteibacter sp.]